MPDASFYAPDAGNPTVIQPVPAAPRRISSWVEQNKDLPAFQIVEPTGRLNLDDLRLQDGTPMRGPDGLLVPAARSFSTVINAATRVFSYRFDEAMRDNFVNARAMRRDAFIRGLLEERLLPTINRRWQLEVPDDTHPDQKLVRDALTRVIQATRGLDAFKRAMLDAVWFGRAGTQWNNNRDPDTDNLWAIGKWDPIHGDSIQFTFEGTPAILLDSMTAAWYSQHGATWGPGGDLRPTDRGGTALVLQRPYWRDRFAIHVHMREKADYFEGELAGSVQGLGLRGLVYWHYVIRTEALTWMLTYMQAVGQMDLLVFNYPDGDAAAKANAESMARRIIGKAAIACPRSPNEKWPAVEQIPMNSEGLKALHELISEYFDRHIERLVVGQSMSAGSDHEDGLGGTGRAEFARACVPVAGSEILTRSGFKSPHNVEIGEDVLAYDAETDTCKWTPLLKKSFYENAPVQRMFIEQNRFEAFCTPDHSWAVERTRFSSDWRNGYAGEMVPGPRGAMRPAHQERYLQKANAFNNRENIILAAPEVGTENSLLSPTEAAILGWVITDGTIKREETKFKGTRYSMDICQSKEEFFPNIRKRVLEFAGTAHETVSHTPYRTFPMDGNTSATKPQHVWYMNRDLTTAFFARIGFTDRSDLPRIVTQLDGPARRAMIEAMMMGDGDKAGTFTNTDTSIMEAFEILCALEGRATGRLKPKKHDLRYKQCYDKQIKSNRYVYGYAIQQEAAGTAEVWCPTTKYGTWVMRQNGRVMITGNTKDEILVYDTNRLDETMTYDVLGPLKRANFPWAKFPVRYKSILPDLEAKDKVGNGQALIQAGVQIKVDEFREAAGYSRPEQGDETIGGPQTAGAMMAPGSTPNSPMHVTGPGNPGQPQPAPQFGPAMTYPRHAGALPPAGGFPIGGNPNPPQSPPTPNMGTAAGVGMGPGGSNTYLPRFGNPDARIGFTRFDSLTPPVPYGQFGCVIAPFHGEAQIAVLRYGAMIADADLAAKGREDEPHLTIRYGFHADVTDRDVAGAIGNHPPVRVRLGKPGVFPGPEYDVVYLAAESPDAIRLHNALAALPHTDSFANYRPHVAVAYVKPGLGRKYVDSMPAADCEIVVDELEYHSPDEPNGNQTNRHRKNR